MLRKYRTNEWESEYLEWLNQSWLNQNLPSSSSEEDLDCDFDSDQSPKGPW